MMSDVRLLALVLAVLMGLVPAGTARARGALDVPPDPLRSAIDQTLSQVAHGLKVRPPRADDRLNQAARLLAGRGGCDVPPHATIQAALWHVGVAEPVHRLLLTRFATAAPDDLVSGLPAQLQTALSSRGGSSGAGRWSLYGFAALPYDAEMSCGVLIILETFIDLTPMVRSHPLGSPPVELLGAVLPPYRRPRLVQTNPQGETAPIPGLPVPRNHPPAGEPFYAHFVCATAGRYQIEVLGEDKRGPSVLANFPLYCGQPAPDFATAAASPNGPGTATEKDTPWQTAADAEARLLQLLNAERQRAGRPALALDDRLVAVARAHSEEMRQHRYIAHVSPRTGGPADRAKRAGIPSTRITENLAQASSPLLAHQGLVGSPGHRANLLDPDVDHVGIGCTIAAPTIPGQPRTIIVTQLFAALKPAVTTPTASAALEAPAIARVNTLRTSANLHPLQPDPALRAIAQQIAAAPLTARDYDARAEQIMKAALPSLAGRFSHLRMSLVGVITPADFGPLRSFMEPALTHIGAVARTFPASAGDAPAGDPRSLIILILAEKQ